MDEKWEDANERPAPPRTDPQLTVSANRERRVDYITELMSLDKWPAWPASVMFRRRLAQWWGISDSVIRTMAAEAHRVIALDPDEREHLRESLAKELREIADEARVNVNVMTGQRDLRTAIVALETMAKFSGIELETKVRISGSVSLEDIDSIRKRVEGAAIASELPTEQKADDEAAGEASEPAVTTSSAETDLADLSSLAMRISGGDE